MFVLDYMSGFPVQLIKSFFEKNGLSLRSYSGNRAYYGIFAYQQCEKSFFLYFNIKNLLQLPVKRMTHGKNELKLLAIIP